MKNILSTSLPIRMGFNGSSEDATDDKELNLNGCNSFYVSGKDATNDKELNEELDAGYGSDDASHDKEVINYRIEGAGCSGVHPVTLLTFDPGGTRLDWLYEGIQREMHVPMVLASRPELNGSTDEGTSGFPNRKEADTRASWKEVARVGETPTIL